MEQKLFFASSFGPGSGRVLDELERAALPGSASGLDALLEPEAQRPDENATRNLRSQAPPGSASRLDQQSRPASEAVFPDWGGGLEDLEMPNDYPLEVEKPASGSSEASDWRSCLEDLDMSDDFHSEVERPVSGSSEASLQQALLVQDARQEKC